MTPVRAIASSLTVETDHADVAERTLATGRLRIVRHRRIRQGVGDRFVAFAIARCAPRREQKQSCEPGLPDARIWARACARSGRDWRSDSWRSGRATNDRAHDASVADAVAGRPAGRGRMRSRKGAPSALRAQASRPRAMSWERSRILATCDRALPARVAGRCWITPEAVTPARLPLGMESGSRSCCPSA
jgi:hypothetical protein